MQDVAFSDDSINMYLDEHINEQHDLDAAFQVFVECHTCELKRTPTEIKERVEQYNQPEPEPELAVATEPLFPCLFGHPSVFLIAY